MIDCRSSGVTARLICSTGRVESRRYTEPPVSSRSQLRSEGSVPPLSWPPFWM